VKNALSTSRARLRKWRLAAAALAASAAVAGAATLTTAGAHPAHGRIGLADSSTSITGQTSASCSPGGSLPVLTPGGITTVLTPSGTCLGTTSGSLPQTTGQQGQSQSCQLTQEQQQALLQRAMNDQAAADTAFQQTLLKNLLQQAVLKAGSALLQQRLSGHTGLSPQDVSDLLNNGLVTPGDMAQAILQTLAELGETPGSSGQSTWTCAGSTPQLTDDDVDNTMAPSSASGGGSSTTGRKDPDPARGGSWSLVDAVAAKLRAVLDNLKAAGEVTDYTEGLANTGRGLQFDVTLDNGRLEHVRLMTQSNLRVNYYRISDDAVGSILADGGFAGALAGNPDATHFPLDIDTSADDIGTILKHLAGL
jgi:hypothetical protein